MTRAEVRAQIEQTTVDIQAALWSVPADLDRARLLISKRMGLRIVAGDVQVRLKKPIVFIADEEAMAA